MAYFSQPFVATLGSGGGPFNFIVTFQVGGPVTAFDTMEAGNEGGFARIAIIDDERRPGAIALLTQARGGAGQQVRFRYRGGLTV
jgi:hypothetical protein